MFIYVNNYKIGIPDDMVGIALQPKSNLSLIPETVTQREARTLLFQVNSIINQLAIELDKIHNYDNQVEYARLVKNVLNDKRSSLLNLDRILRKNAPYNYYRCLEGVEAATYTPNGGYFHIIVEDEYNDLRLVLLFHNRAIKRLEGTAVSLLGYTCKRVIVPVSDQIEHAQSTIDNLIDSVTKEEVLLDHVVDGESAAVEPAELTTTADSDSISNVDSHQPSVFHVNANDDELCYEVTMDLMDAPLLLKSINGEFLNLDLEVSMNNCSSFSLAKLDEVSYSRYEIIQDTTTVKNLGEVNFIHFNDVMAQLIEHLLQFEYNAPQLEFSSDSVLALEDVRKQVERGLAIDTLVSNLTTISELTDEVSTLTQIDNVELLTVLKEAKHGLLVFVDTSGEDNAVVDVLGTYLDELSYYREYGNFISKLTQLQWTIPFIVGTLFKNNTLDKAVANDIKTIESEIAQFASYKALSEADVEKLNVMIDMLNATQVKLTNTLIAQHIDKSQADILEKVLNALSSIDYRSPVYKTPFIFDGSSLTGGCHKCELDPEGSGDIAVLYNSGLSVLLPQLTKREGVFTVTVESSADCTGAKNSEVQHFNREYFLLGEFTDQLAELYYTHYGETSHALEMLRIDQITELSNIKSEIEELLKQHRDYQHAVKQITHLNIALDKLREYQRYFVLGLDKDLDVLPFRLLSDLPYAAYDKVEIIHNRLRPQVRDRIMHVMSVYSSIDFNFGTYTSANISEMLENTIVGSRISLKSDELPFNQSCKIGYNGPGFTGQLTSETLKVELSKGYNTARPSSFPVNTVMAKLRQVSETGFNILTNLARHVPHVPIPFTINWNLNVLPSLEARAVNEIAKSVFSSSLLNARSTENAIRKELFNTSLFRQMCERIVSEFDEHINELTAQAGTVRGKHTIRMRSSKSGEILWTLPGHFKTYRFGNLDLYSGAFFHYGSSYVWDRSLPVSSENLTHLWHATMDHSMTKLYFVDYPKFHADMVKTHRTEEEAREAAQRASNRTFTYGINSTPMQSIYAPAANTICSMSDGSLRESFSGEVLLNMSEDPNAPSYFLAGVGTCDSATPWIDHDFANDSHWPPVTGSATCEMNLPVNFIFSETVAKQIVQDFNALKESDLQRAFQTFLNSTGLGSEWDRFERIFLNGITHAVNEYRNVVQNLHSQLDNNLISLLVPDVNDPSLMREIHLKDVYDDQESYEEERSKTWYIQRAAELHPTSDNYSELYNLYSDTIGGIKYEMLEIDSSTDRKILLHHDLEYDIYFYLNLLRSGIKSNDLTSTDFNDISVERSKDFSPTDNYIVSYAIGTKAQDTLFEDPDNKLEPDEFVLSTTLGTYTLKELVSARLVKPQELREMVCYKRGFVEDLANVVRGLFKDAHDVIGYLNDESEATDDVTGHVGFPYSPASFLANIMTDVNPRKYAIDKLTIEIGHKTGKSADDLLTDPGVLFSEEVDNDNHDVILLLDVEAETPVQIQKQYVTTRLFPNDTFIETSIESIRNNLKQFAQLAKTFPRLMLTDKGLDHLEVNRSQETVFDNLYVLRKVLKNKVSYKFLFTADQILFLEAVTLLHNCKKGNVRNYKHNLLYSILVSPDLGGYIVIDKTAYQADVLRG